jgi:hypothetical protein
MNDKFSCPDARGGRCLMLSEIDAKVSSGEVGEFYKEKRCFGRHCGNGDSKPQIAGNRDLKAKITKDESPGEYLDGDDLYVK